MSNTNEVETVALDALDEYVASCTVAIASINGEVEHGSGVAVKFNDQCYILTAAHVLKGEPDNERIRIVGRPDGPLQMLRGKQELKDAIRLKTHRPAFASATAVCIIDRLTHELDDIAALKVHNPIADLPRTIFHDLSVYKDSDTAVGTAVTIYGFPGELAQHYEQRLAGRSGWAAFPHITIEEIKDISSAPEKLQPSIDLITSFDYPEETCNPRGMSGCGAWSFPGAQKGQLWHAGMSQLLGILIGHYRDAKILRFVRSGRVQRLLYGS